jgi:hypothetical protein
MQAGTLPECETAGGDRVAMRALGPPQQGHDFRVVWVRTQEEYDRAQRTGQEPSGIPWPYSSVLRVLDESNLATRQGSPRLALHGGGSFKGGRRQPGDALGLE